MAKVKATKDKYGLFWTIEVEAKGVKAITTMSEKVTARHPKIKKLIAGMTHTEK